MNVESLFQFLFKRGEFLSQLALVAKERAHFEKGANHKNTHLHGSLAVQNIGCHNRAVLGENPRQVLAMLAATAL